MAATIDIVVVQPPPNIVTITSPGSQGPPGPGSASGTGFVHVTAGVVDAAARAVDLSTADVTGILPDGNQAPQTMLGDIVGTTAASIVKFLSGVAGATTLVDGNALVLSSTGTPYSASALLKAKYYANQVLLGGRYAAGAGAFDAAIVHQIDGVLIFGNEGTWNPVSLRGAAVQYYAGFGTHTWLGASALTNMRLDGEELRVGYETTHSTVRLTPWGSNPTAYAAVYLLPGATGTAGGNYTLLGSGTDTYVNVPGVAGHLYLVNSNVTTLVDITTSTAKFHVPIQLDFTAAGVKPTTGTGMRFAYYAGTTTVIAGSNGTLDSRFLQQNGGSWLLGDDSATTGMTFILRGYGITLQSQAGVALNIYFSGSNLHFGDYTSGNACIDFSVAASGGSAGMQFTQNITASITQAIAVTNVNGNALSITAQAAKSGAAGNGGNLALASGAKDGAGANGSVTISCGAALQVTVTEFQWLFAGSTALTSAGDIYLGSSTLGFYRSAGSGVIAARLSSGSGYFSVGTSTQDLLQFKTTNGGVGSIEIDAACNFFTFKQADAASGNNGVNMIFAAQAGVGTNKDGGNMSVRGGARTGTGLKGGVHLALNGTSEVMVEVHNVTDGQRFVALCRGANMTTTEFPTGCGDLVVYLGVAATAPTADPVSGFLIYMDPADNKLKARGPSGNVTELAVP